MEQDLTPQLENGYTRIANEILENLAKLTISGQSYQILLIIFRQTYGYGRNNSRITLDQFVEYTNGATKPRILKVIKQLVDKNIIVKQKIRFGTMYGFNKNANQWILNNEKINQKDNDLEPDNPEINAEILDDLKSSEIVEKDNTIVQKDNRIVQKDNKHQQAINDKIVDDKLKVINNSKPPENALLYKESIKEKDLFTSNEVNGTDTFDNGKPPKDQAPKVKRSLLDSPDCSQRLCGWWDKCFFDINKQKFMHSWKKDMVMFKGLLNNYDEQTAKNIISIFFEWTTNKEKWQYEKPTLEVLMTSIPSIIVEYKKRLSSNAKPIVSPIKTEIKEEIKEFQSVKFMIMMADLKKQYGTLEAPAHITEYKNMWFNNLTNMVVVIEKAIIKKST